MSGGHCLLAVAKDVTDFLLLGSNLDSAPGDVLDKVLYVVAPGDVFILIPPVKALSFHPYMYTYM